MSDLSKPTEDTIEQNQDVTGSSETPSAVEELQGTELPMDANEADVLEQAQEEPNPIDEYPADS